MENIDTSNLPKYSFSKIRSFENCRYGFFEHYFNDKRGINHGTSEFGGFCHKILEDYEDGKLSEFELLPYYTDNYDNNVTSSFVLKMSEDFSKDFAQDYYESGKEYFKNFEGFNDFKILEAEYEFYTVINNQFVFNGKIDLVAEDKDGNLIIIDHKSKSKFKSKAELKEYARQLYLYAYATYEKYHKYPVKMMFNRFRKNEWTVIDFKKEDFDEALNWAITNVEEIENTFDFFASPNTFFCNNFCEFRECCDKRGE